MKFLITIDTEADNQWARRTSVEVRNIRYIPRFQELCDQYGFKPTYLTSYEMADSQEFIATVGPYQDQQRAEIGAHLHPWTTPPFDQLTENDAQHHPFPYEYPQETLARKLEALTDIIEQNTGKRPVTFRAGRYGFDGKVMKILENLGYIADCSVTPLVSWKKIMGNPKGRGGPDFTTAPAEPYFPDYGDCNRKGHSRLLEVPISIFFLNWSGFNRLFRMVKRVAHDPANIILRGLYRMNYRPFWFRPHPDSQVEHFRQLYRTAQRTGVNYVEMMFHSSELMPGGSKNTRDEQAVEQLYRVFTEIFDFLKHEQVESQTLTEYAQSWIQQRTTGDVS